MKLRRKLTWIYLVLCLPVLAQQDMQLVNNWDYRRKTSDIEKINKVIAATNGDLIAVGEAPSESYQDLDGLFVVLDAVEGTPKAWKRFGGVGDQAINSIAQNPDGTFTLVGYSSRESKNKEGWIATLDIDGEIIDQRTVQGGESKNAEFQDLEINPDGIVMAIGYKTIGKSEAPWVVQINGDLKSKELPQLENLERLADITVANHDFVLLGSAGSLSRKNSQQIWISKIDGEGKDQWDGVKYFGDNGHQEGLAINYTESDDGFIIAGVTNTGSAGSSDMWVLKLDDQGNLLWEKTYGGAAADVPSCVTELSMGGYAIFGHTKSHLVGAATPFAMKLILTDANGEEIDDDLINIVHASGDQIAYSMVESMSSKSIVLAGNSTTTKSDQNSKTLVTTYDYYFDNMVARSHKGDDETFGNSVQASLSLSNSFFYDADQDNVLERGERGYIEVEVTNEGPTAQENVIAEISTEGRAEISFWETVFLGKILSGQTKKLRIPLQASDNPQRGSYDLNFSLKSNGKFCTTGNAIVRTNQPNPPDLIANRYYFSPAANPAPGEPITLTIELENIGGAPTDELTAGIRLPAGIISKRSDMVKIPVLESKDKHIITFQFSFEEHFSEPEIRVQLTTNSTEKVVGFTKDCVLPLQQKVITQSSAVAVSDFSNEILWTSHDVDEFRTVDVNRNVVDLKVIALSQKQMNKRNFAVLINGRRSQGQKLDEAQLSPPKNKTSGRIQHTYVNSVQLAEGLNEVQIVYFAEDGKTIISKSTPLTFHYIPKDKPNLHVLSIGVQHGDLNYTVNDAKAFANMYQQLQDKQGRGFKKVHIYPLVTEEQTTENNIKKAFLNLSKNRSIKDNDLVVVFISSHGKVIDGDRYVLLPSDYDPQYEELSTIDFNDDILKRLRSVDGNKLVFIDACHSGSAGSRSFSDAAASQVMNDLIEATSGMEIFASCGDNEFSYEDESWANGAFTKAIMEAFENQSVKIDGKMVQADIYRDSGGTKERGQDGVISIEELKLFVQQRVPFLVKTVKNKPQNPTNKSTELLPKDMGIYMVNQK